MLICYCMSMYFISLISTFPNINISFLSFLLSAREHLDSIPPNTEELSFGNSVYKITFENHERPLFGHKYWFFLQDAVENVPEYVVQWENFEQYVSFLLDMQGFLVYLLFTKQQNLLRFFAVISLFVTMFVKTDAIHRTSLCLCYRFPRHYQARSPLFY